ncbi:MAG: methyltransferase domain-containing protein [Candidatus Woesearchaeota archaeon]|nr:methyltransferase domain-containing protein [Candidatus Woesearchaeota archaeon]
MPRFAALTTEGIENISLEELKGLGKLKNTWNFKGMILFDSEYSEEFLKAKTVEDVLVFVQPLENISRYRKTLAGIRFQVGDYSIPYEAKTFSVKASYIGRRDYTAKEIEEIMAEEITKRYKWKLNKESADVYFHVILHPDFSLIGVSLGEQPMNDSRRMQAIPGSLKNSVASAMIRISGVKKGKLLDPMCGTGVIPIESSLLGFEACGSDIDEKNIEIAKKNNEQKKSAASFSVMDAKKTSYKDDEFDAIICNLPFGKQFTLDDEFYEKFLLEMRRVSKKDATLVFLTKKDIDAKIFKLIEEIKIVNSGLELKILKFQNVK